MHSSKLPHWQRLALSLFLPSFLITNLLLFTALPHLALAAAQLSLSVTSGPRGTSLSASGSGFQPGETVVLRWNAIAGEVLSRTAADADGRFSNASFMVPVVSPGTYNVWAIGDSSIVYATAEFTVAGSTTTSPTATSTPVPTSTTAPLPTPTPTPTASPLAGVTTLPGGPLPATRAPVAVAVDEGLGRVYVVHRRFYRDLDVNADLLPTDTVSVVDQATGTIITTIPVGTALNGVGQGIAVDDSRNRVYVTNSDDDTVSIIDGSANIVVATVQVGAGPQGIAVDKERGLVYVANSFGKSVTILDAVTGHARGTVELTGGVYAVAVDPLSHLAYATVRAAPWTVVAIDSQTQSVVAQVPLNLLLSLSDITVDPGSRVYVTDYDTGMVAVIDISGGTPKEVARFSGGLFPNAVRVDPNTHLLFVADSGTNRVGVFAQDGTRVKSTEVLRLPSSISIAQGARRVYITDTLSDSLTVLDADTQTVTGTFPLGTADFGIAYDPTTNRLYAANYPADAVSVVDPATRRVVASWIAGPGPAAVALDAGVQQLYVLNTDDRSLSILSTADGRIKGKVDVGANPVSVSADPRTHRVYATSSNGLTVLDGTINQVVVTVAVGSRPAGIAIDETRGKIYVASLGSGTISVVDAATNHITAPWQPPLSSVWGLAVDPGRQRLYVTIPPNTIGDFSGVEVLDSSTGDFIANIYTGNRVSLAAVNPRTSQIFVTDSHDGTLTIIDGASHSIAATVPVGRRPNGLAVDQQSGIVYVANFADGTISVVDPGKISVGTPTVTPTASPPAQPTVQPTTTPSPTATLCTDPTPTPGASQPLSPANCANLSTFETTLQWSNSSGATQFELRILPFGLDGPALDMIGDVEGSTSSFNILKPPTWYFLLPDMTYTWIVRTTTATVSIGTQDPRWGPWSPGWILRTPKANSATIGPVSPGDGAAVTSLTPTLQWQNTSPTTWYYEVQVSTDPSFETNPSKATASVYWELRHGGATSPPNSYTIPSDFPLIPGATYYWRVRPRIQGDGTPLPWTASWGFTAPRQGDTPTPSPTQTAMPTVVPTPSSESTAALLGTWTVFSARIYYEDGGSGSDNPARYGQLELRSDGTWQFGSSTGSWHTTAITGADWTRWGVQSYGPTRKLVLVGWSDGVADGPVEESGGQVDFLWVISPAAPPTVSTPGTVWLKFGHR